MKFILSRTNDFESHSKKWIVGYGLLFWLVTRLLAVVMMMVCTAIYGIVGIDPDQLTKFGGDPVTVRSVFSVGYGLLMVLIIAPLLEESIFRLGLSFRKWQIAVAAAAIPAYLLSQWVSRMSVTGILAYAGIAAAVFCVIYFLTSQKFWTDVKRNHFKSAVWLSAITFGLIHLIAFSNFSIALLPYMLCVISIPFFAGCAITYYRVNLGFWPGVGLHIFNNLPAIVMLVST